MENAIGQTPVAKTGTLSAVHVMTATTFLRAFSETIPQIRK